MLIGTHLRPPKQSPVSPGLSVFGADFGLFPSHAFGLLAQRVVPTPPPLETMAGLRLSCHLQRRQERVRTASVATLLLQGLTSAEVHLAHVLLTAES